MFYFQTVSTMKKFFVPGLVAGVVLLALSYVGPLLMVKLVPSIAEEYYNPVFDLEGNKIYLYFLHPFVISFALAWFWERFKSLFHGSFFVRGLEMGIVYALVATLPAMWIVFSAMSVSATLVVSWLVYGLLQAVVAGLIYAKMNP